ncbi:hypothetical protein RclHR1_10960003 [Rhizophagus clarus]|uniref:Uncharacterized protein n=1 Tax=Rhizophagus clarus TaxID=94130 RepID=A0A2Z6QHR1_9GLOM|nr:hypothetical protein RclHR1_10960003 [Rhizophagus clarus]
MESQNFYSVLADVQEEITKDNLVYNIVLEIFFNTFSALISGALETLLQGCCQRPYDDQISILVNTFGEHAHPKNYHSLSQRLAGPGPLISILFNLSKKAAKEALIPVFGYLDCLMDKTSTVSENPEIEDHSRDEMDDMTLDTNQLSSRIISEKIPEPIPVQASSSTLISKSGKDKSEGKKSNDQHKKGKDTPKPDRKSADKNSKKITKMIVMKDIPDNLKNNVRDVMLYDVLAEWSPETLLIHLTTWGQVASISIKAQHKYCTVRLKIAFNDFTLQAFDGGKWCHRLHNLEVRGFWGGGHLSKDITGQRSLQKQKVYQYLLRQILYLPRTTTKEILFLRIKALRPINSSSKVPIM